MAHVDTIYFLDDVRGNHFSSIKVLAQSAGLEPAHKRAVRQLELRLGQQPMPPWQLVSEKYVLGHPAQ